MFKFALFDLDGTLTDPKIGITTCVQYALRSFGIEEDLEKLTPFIGPPLKDSFMEFYGFDEKKAECAIDKYRERFSTVGLFENEIYPGIERMLAFLHKNGVKLAVASSKPTVFVEKILKHFHIDTYFDVVIGSELDGRRTDKQEIVSEALSSLGVTDDNRDTCVMIGDRKFDIIGAKAEHVFSVGVTFGYALPGELEQEKPDYIAHSVEELENYIMTGASHEPYKRSAVSLRNTFSIILPILVYYFSYNFIMILLASVIRFFSLNGGQTTTIADFFAGHSQGTSVIIQFLAMTIGAGLLLPSFLREKPVIFHKGTNKGAILCVALLGIFSALFFNILFSQLHFTGSSMTYREVANAQFSLSLLMGLFLYGIVSPLAEEMVFRGLVYNRLRKYFPYNIAFLMSGVLFGVYHGNLVQGVYGFILGLIITWAYDRFGSFLIPVLVHSVANMAVYVTVNLEELQKATFTSSTCVITGLLMVICVFILRNIKSTN